VPSMLLCGPCILFIEGQINLKNTEGTIKNGQSRETDNIRR